MIYFSSDIHFGDNSTLINDNRPFKTSDEFDKYLINLWNKQTTKDDTIYVIGDFIDCDGIDHADWKNYISLVKKLKAKIVLVIGNNEERVIKYFFDNDFEAFRKYCIDQGFEDVHKDLIVKVNGIDFFLTHKPYNARKDMLNLFGHSHRAQGLYHPLGFNIGCDINHFRPYGEQDIAHLLNMKTKFWDKDKSLNMKI